MAPRLAPKQCAAVENWQDKAVNWRFRVELRGFEPLTPSMRTRCATGLRYSPWTASQRSKCRRFPRSALVGQPPARRDD